MKEFYNTNVLYLKNLPFKMLVQFSPKAESNDIYVNMFAYAGLIKDIYKTK
jgi:hypothetical protein